MKTLKTLIFTLSILFISTTYSQTADEIVENYLENTGGKANWEKLDAVKYEGTVNMQGMVIPITMLQTKDGKQLLKANVQGQELVQFSFDGETMWTTNFMTMQPEKSDQEATDNMKKQTKDFPSPFLNYKDKGFTLEFLGKETMDGTETFKLKLSQEPLIVDGKEEANVSYHYFDTENYVPIASETEIKQGPMKGQMSKSTFSDYEEVDGLYFPFSINMGGQPITFTKIILNPEFDMSEFAFPETEENPVEKK
ncbi:MAG: outer membrane lipoprotein-sorting protein [Flavobacteriales bacterium]